MSRVVALAAVSAALAIGAGAFGAHVAGPRAAELLRTGAGYQLAHAAAAVALAPRDPAVAGVLLASAALFALSLYALAVGAPSAVGIMTPIGGSVMIGGWLWLAVRSLRR